MARVRPGTACLTRSSKRHVAHTSRLLNFRVSVELRARIQPVPLLLLISMSRGLEVSASKLESRVVPVDVVARIQLHTACSSLILTSQCRVAHRLRLLSLISGSLSRS